MGAVLFDCIKNASKISDEIIVFFSGGKDSVVTLDLCCKYFKKVVPVHMYLVQGLSFVEYTIEYYEKKYDLEMIRVPHFMLSEWLKYGTLRLPDYNIRIIKIKNIYDYIREQTGIHLIAAGERISDSIVRRAMIKQSSTIDLKRGRIYPVAEWSKKDILNYVKFHNLKITPEYNKLGFSFRSLESKDLSLIKEHYPNDFELIKKQFPHAEASEKQYEFFQKKNQ